MISQLNPAKLKEGLRCAFVSKETARPSPAWLGASNAKIRVVPYPRPRYCKSSAPQPMLVSGWLPFGNQKLNKFCPSGKSTPLEGVVHTKFATGVAPDSPRIRPLTEAAAYARKGVAGESFSRLTWWLRKFPGSSASIKMCNLRSEDVLAPANIDGR